MIKKSIGTIVSMILACFMVSVSFLPLKQVNAESSKPSLIVNSADFEYKFGEQYSGNENNPDNYKRSGLLLTSKNHGEDAEGITFALNEVYDGEFSMDFRVISEQRYQLNPNRENEYGYTHVIKDSNASFNALASDNWNPYQDLKEVAFTFTSKSDPSKYFVVYINGTTSHYAAFLCTAKVYVPGDHIPLLNGKGSPDAWQFEQKGYGLNADGVTVYEPAYWNHTSLQQTLIRGTSFTNFVSYSDDYELSPYLEDVKDGLTRTFSNIVRFDPATMSVYVNGNDRGEKKYYGTGSYVAETLVRDIDDNTRFESANNYTAGSLDKSYFADGYSVKVTFSDVTADDTVGEKGFVNEKGEFELYMYNPDQYNMIDEAYDRYARMLIYNINGRNLNEDNFQVTDFVEPILSFKNETDITLDRDSEDFTKPGYDLSNLVIENIEEVNKFYTLSLDGIIEPNGVKRVSSNFTELGTYKLVYAVTDNLGYKTTVEQIVHIKDETAPRLEIGKEVTIYQNRSITFDDYSVYDLSPTNVKIEVLYNGEVVSTGRNFTGKKAGEYTVRYTATDEFGNTEIKEKNLTVESLNQTKFVNYPLIFAVCAVAILLIIGVIVLV